jgi:hypothetical protein
MSLFSEKHILNNGPFWGCIGAIMSHQSHRRYEVALKGQASKLDFYLDKTELDFGEVPYTEALFSGRWMAFHEFCLRESAHSQHHPAIVGM